MIKTVDTSKTTSNDIENLKIMTTEITHYIRQANEESRFLSSEEIDRINSYISSGERRVKVAQTLANLNYFIVEETSKILYLISPEAFRPGGNAFGLRKTSKCLRDLDFYLRLITYGIVAASFEPIQEIGLNGAREGYLSLGTPLNTIANAVFAMKTVMYSCLSEDADLAQPYFDFVISYFSDSQGINESRIREVWSARQALFDFSSLQDSQGSGNEPLKLANCRSDSYDWEPKCYNDFVKLDKLIRYHLDHGIEDEQIFEESCRAFYENWQKLPHSLRRRVWREREVIALLSSSFDYWNSLDGFSHVGVSYREISGRSRLVGVLFFMQYIPEISEQMYEQFNIPKFIRIDSTVNDLNTIQEELIPIVFERGFPKVEFNALENSSPITEQNLDFCQQDICDPHTGNQEPLLQIGDMISGGDSIENVNPKKRVTLSCFVTSQSSEPEQTDDLKMMSVWHGFKGGLDKAFVQTNPDVVEIGFVDFSNKRQEEIAKKLDICLLNPLSDVDFHPHLKWTDSSPGNACIVWGGMLVQMWGGNSGHVMGYISHSMIVFPGSASSAIPEFTAAIQSAPGDSGSLLVSGHKIGDPIENPESKGLDPDFIASMKFASLGILISGSTGDTYQNLTYFRPMVEICHQLKIKVFPPSLF